MQRTPALLASAPRRRPRGGHEIPRQKTDLHRRDSWRESREREVRRHVGQQLEGRRQNGQQNLVLCQRRKRLHLRTEKVGNRRKTLLKVLNLNLFLTLTLTQI